MGHAICCCCALCTRLLALELHVYLAIWPALAGANTPSKRGGGCCSCISGMAAL